MQHEVTPPPPQEFPTFKLGRIEAPAMNLLGDPDTPFSCAEVRIETDPASSGAHRPDYPIALKAAKASLEEMHRRRYSHTEIADNPLPRLEELVQAGETEGNLRGGLTLRFGLTTFSTFMATNRSLDYSCIPSDGILGRIRTIRDAYVRFPYRLHESVLANPLSANVFLISRTTAQTPTEQVIIRQRSSNVALYRGAFQASAAGFVSVSHLDAQGRPNPFVTAVSEAREEISSLLPAEPAEYHLLGIAVNWEDLDINAYGFMVTDLAVADLLGGFRRDDYEGSMQSLPFEPECLLNHLVSNRWEPISVVASFIGVDSFFGYSRVMTWREACHLAAVSSITMKTHLRGDKQ